MYALAIVGGIVSAWQIYLWLKPHRKVSWREVEKGVLKLRDDLINKNYFPILIIGIGRGGSVIGALLSGSFGNISIIVIDRVYEMKKYIAYFNSIHAEQVKTLTFVKEPFPAFNPDFCCLVSSNSDIRLPWMLTEHYKHESQIDYTHSNS
jgi:hypothetical protein